MRALIGFLILASLFWMAASWQSRHTDRIRREREQLHGRVASRFNGSSAPIDLEDSLPPPGQSSARWSTLVIGRPSGKAPHQPLGRGNPAGPQQGGPFVDRSSATGPAALPGSVPASHTPANSSAAPFLYRVRRGDVLGTICADYYGGARGPFENLTQLTLAVARYNDLGAPDDIGTGSEIKLPSLEELAR